MKRNKVIIIILIVSLWLLIAVKGALGESKITLDKKGRAGCLSCHADKNIFRTVKGKKESLYINPDRFYKSVHKNRSCIDCHTDWEFRTHKVKSGNFKKTAGLACIRCHKHQDKYKIYKNSVHGRIALGGEKSSGKEAVGKDAPTCGTCHNGLEPRGIHYIQKYPKKPKTWRDSKYWTKFRFSADKICGQCHMDRYKSFNDYYHGRAYKTREVDAPTCWTCHNQHSVFRQWNSKSTISKKNIAKTCGRCHPNPSESFVNQYQEMIHGRQNIHENNIVVKLFTKSSFGTPFRWATEKIIAVYDSGVGLVKNIIKIFFPENLRPQKEIKD